MKAAGTAQIKEELQRLPPKKLLEICLRLARFKKENKELLSYLLFDAGDEEGYVTSIKIHIDEQFSDLPKGNWYLSKKGLRKILRSISKYAKYTGSKEAEAELLFHFCDNLKKSGIAYRSYKALSSLYDSQLKKLNSLVKQVHEDLKFDYERKLEELQHEPEQKTDFTGKLIKLVTGRK